jgi:hypothetical protein
MVSKKSKIIFLMPPKTASQSLTESLLDSSIRFDEINIQYPKIHLFLSELVEAHDIKNIEEYKIIQVTREPLERYISSYFHQKKILKGIKTKISDMDIDDFTEHFHDCLGHSNFIKNFYGNEKVIKNMILSGKSWGGSRLYLNQTQWNDLDMPIHYFKLEELQDGLEAISDLIGLYIPDLPQKNVGKNKKISTEYVENMVDLIFNSDYKILGY